MSDYLRYLVTVDVASGEPVKVEQVGAAGDLTQVDLQSFVRSLGGSASPQPQIVVNIFGGGAGGAVIAGPAAAQAPGPPPLMASTGPSPITPPPPPPPPPKRTGGKRTK